VKKLPVSGFFILGRGDRSRVPPFFYKRKFASFWNNEHVPL
jgi:hypothetical protein